MSAISDIIAFDGAATPASHTFKPQSVTREAGLITALWKEVVSTVPDAAQGTVIMSLKKLSSGIYRVNTRVSLPVMEAIAGNNSSGYTAPPKVAYIDTVDSVGYFSERGTIAGRRLSRQLTINILGGITTSVTPVTTGPVAELFDLLLMPT
jgi:hypothetical protein